MATVFIISAYCGLTNQWSGQPSSVPTESLLSWEQVRTLADEGYEIGAHMRSHLSLLTILAQDAEAEMHISQQQIQAHIKQEIKVFAYPYGATNTAITQLAQLYFDGAVITDLGFIHAQTNPYLLNRIDAYYLSPLSIPYIHSDMF